MLRIGPAGAPISTPSPRGTLEGVRRCKELGLPAMEVEFVQGVRMKSDLAATIGIESQRLDISLSVHGPYFVNLCSDEPAKLANSRRHLLQSAQMSSLMHASPVVFHPGFYQGRPKEECAKRAKAQLQQVLDEMGQQRWDEVALGPELTGKQSAYGDLDEILELARHFGIKAVQPVVDFGHYHARLGRLSAPEDFAAILDKAEKVLGSDYKKGFHCHYSEISFSQAGELKHLPIGNGQPKPGPKPGSGAGGPPYQPLLDLLNERGYSGTVICESPELENDAKILWDYYRKISGAGPPRAKAAAKKK
ncbi:MAG: TIM barrel protein [Candidatus Micrarchaeota archaeon]|nr:TIM barrel protein [Candidatus Micrarchaeota archaeon]